MTEFINPPPVIRCQEEMKENVSSQTYTPCGEEVQTGKDAGI